MLNVEAIFQGNYQLLSEQHTIGRNIKCSTEAESQMNLKSKAKFARATSCQRYFLFSLSVSFFLVTWQEDMEEFDVRYHLSSNYLDCANEIYALALLPSHWP